MTHGLIRPVSHLIGILRYLTKNEKLSGVLITGSKYEYNFFSNTGHWILYWLCYLCLMKDLSMLVVMDVERERQPHCFKDQCWYKMFHWDLSNTGYAHTWPHTRHTYLHEHTHIHGRTHAHTQTCTCTHTPTHVDSHTFWNQGLWVNHIASTAFWAILYWLLSGLKDNEEPPLKEASKSLARLYTALEQIKSRNAWTMGFWCQVEAPREDH